MIDTLERIVELNDERREVIRKVQEQHCQIPGTLVSERYYKIWNKITEQYGSCMDTKSLEEFADLFARKSYITNYLMEAPGDLKLLRDC